MPTASLGRRSSPGLTSSTFVSDSGSQPSNPTHLPGSIEADLVSSGDPHEIMERLVRFAVENVEGDRGPLKSLDEDVLRAEGSYERGGPPDFVGREYPMTWLARQPLLS